MNSGSRQSENNLCVINLAISEIVAKLQCVPYGSKFFLITS